MNDRFHNFSSEELAHMGSYIDNVLTTEDCIKRVLNEIINPLLNDVRPEKTIVKQLRKELKAMVNDG